MKNKKSLILILASLPFLSIAFYFFMIPRDSLQKGPMYELLEKKVLSTLKADIIVSEELILKIKRLLKMTNTL